MTEAVSVYQYVSMYLYVLHKGDFGLNNHKCFIIDKFTNVDIRSNT